MGLHVQEAEFEDGEEADRPGADDDHVGRYRIVVHVVTFVSSPERFRRGDRDGRDGSGILVSGISDGRHRAGRVGSSGVEALINRPFVYNKVLPLK